MTSFDAASWMRFFKAAGIQNEASAIYATIFFENRIKIDMLMDLNKDYLREMGISPMGDVIAILRHAKFVHEQTTRERVLSVEMKVPKVAKIEASIVNSVPQQVKVESVQPQNKSKIMPPVNVVKTRRVLPEHEGRYKIILPSGSTMRSKQILAKKAMLQYQGNQPQKSTIFDRLGAEEENNNNKSETKSQTIKITGLSKPASSVFKRLGDKSDTEDNNTFTVPRTTIVKKTQTAPSDQKVILVKKIKAKAATMISDEYEMDKMELGEQVKSVTFSDEDEIVEIAPRRLVVKPRLLNLNLAASKMINSVKTRLGAKTNLNLTKKTINFKPENKNSLIGTKLKSDEILTKQPIHKRLQINNLSSLTKKPIHTRLQINDLTKKLSISRIAKFSSDDSSKRVKMDKSVFNRLG